MKYLEFLKELPHVGPWFIKNEAIRNGNDEYPLCAVANIRSTVKFPNEKAISAGKYLGIESDMLKFIVMGADKKYPCVKTRAKLINYIGYIRQEKV